jgi:hypothetical protein
MVSHAITHGSKSLRAYYGITYADVGVCAVCTVQKGSAGSWSSVQAR